MRRHLSRGLLVPAGLGLLVLLLGALQYRWFGQISNAQRVQLQRALTQQAEAFADEIGHELLRLYLTFRIDSAALRPGDWDAFVRRYDLWRETTPYPQIVEGFYLLTVPADGGPDHEPSLRKYQPDDRTFAQVAWPRDFGPIRERARQIHEHIALDEETRGARPNRDPIVASVPALLIVPPRWKSIDRTRPDADLSPVRQADSLIVVALDRAQLTSLLPTLAERHFPDSEDAVPYRLAVIEPQAAERPVFARDTARSPTSDWMTADVRVPLFSFRVDVAAAISRTLSAIPSLSAPSELQGRVRPGGVFLADGWQLVVRHSAGSLENAVSQARRSNLWLGFGVLSILVAGLAFVVVNARRSQQLASQQMEFVATVTHELRTPLAVIRSASQNLTEGIVHDPDRVVQYGRLIEAEGQRLTDMMEQVLEFAGLTGSRRPASDRAIDLAALAQEVVSSRQELFQAHGIGVTVKADGEIPPIAADEQAIRRAIDNLVINALKHGAEGRWIGITVRCVSVGGRDEVQLSVSDRGRGIDAADLPHIFQPFYRGRTAITQGIQGSGFGLALVRRIAEAHGGRVTVASRPGEETRFTLHLPITRAAEMLGAPVREV